MTTPTDIYYGRQLNRKLGELLLNELTPLKIEEYMSQRRTDGVSDITIHHELNLLRHAFLLAFKQWDLIDQNPFDKIKLPSGDRKRVRYLAPDEEEGLLNALRSDARRRWLLSVVIIARETGLRLSNICDLTWKQVDLVNRSIEIEKTKNGKPVWVPMSPNVYAELVGLGKVRNLNSDRVFMVDEKLLHRGWVGLAFRRLCKRAGVKNFRFHDLRHDFCSRLIQRGQPLHVVAEQAGHEDVSTTQRYAHLSPEVKRKAIDSSFGYSQIKRAREKTRKPFRFKWS